VTNTASSPVIAQDTAHQAAQIVEIECGYQPGSSASPLGCRALDTFGDGSPSYIVPAQKTLVVTAVDILSGAAAGSPCSSPAFAVLIAGANGFNGTRKAWIVPGGAGTVHFEYPSGILFSSGATIVSVANETTTCTLTLDMHGYLTQQ